MRVISMVPSWTETLIDAGVDVVGRTRFCIHPGERVQSIPTVGGTKDIVWEKVKTLKADLLILDQEENPESMSVDSPIPWIASHILSVADVSRDLKLLATVLKNKKLFAQAERWEQISSVTPTPKDLRQLVVKEWIRPLKGSEEEFVYLIWKGPWMAVSKGTFIGSVFRLLGFGPRMRDFTDPYPEVDLSQFDPKKTCLLASSEPFPFGKKKADLENLPFSVALVDGEAYSWFGMRSLLFLERNLK